MSKNNLRDNKENISKRLELSLGDSEGSINNREYNSIPLDRFYTEKEEVTLRFYQTPKALFKNPKYKGLSLGPKLMYSILRDRLDLSIKNNWKDENGFIYLIFSLKELIQLLAIDEKTVIKYKKELVKYDLIVDKRVGQGNPNRIYVLKPELGDSQNWNFSSSRTVRKILLEQEKIHSNDTKINKTNLNNVNTASREGNVENSRGVEKKYPIIKGYRSREKEQLAKEIAEELDDNHSLGAFRTIVDKISEQKIRIFLSVIKDTYLTGKIKKNGGAMFISLAKAYAVKNGVNLNFR
jgi:hypothetical protein